MRTRRGDGQFNDALAGVASELQVRANNRTYPSAESPKLGSVATRFGCPVVNYERGLPLRSEPEGLFDVVDLSDDVALRQPADLSFSDHVHGFIPRNGSQCPID